jgi:monoamine oxidase
VDWRAGSRTTYTGLFAQPDPAAEAEVAAVATRLQEMAAEAPLEAPWTAPKAAEWDDMALHQWLRDNVMSPGARAVLARAIEGVFCAGPGRTSLLAALFWARSGDPLTPFAAPGTGPDRRFAGGGASYARAWPSGSARTG